jgi:hypothetical protein
MEYQTLIKDFAQRTYHNLKTIRKIQAEHSEYQIYEVTLLINSMLGLLVFPRENFIKHIPRTPLSELEAQGWPIPQISGNYPQVEDLHMLIRYLRNAISHCNLEFISDEYRTITGLMLWNNRFDGSTNWKATMQIDDLDKMTEKLISLLSE